MSLLCGGPTVKVVIVVRVGFPLGFVNDAIFVFWWAVQTVQFEFCSFTAVDHIVSGSCWNDDRKSVAHRVFLTIQDDGSLTFLEAKKPIQLVYLFSDFLTGLEIHQRPVESVWP
jgi:hypothetical protein